MPHLTVEHSANLSDHCDVQSLVDRIHETALTHEVPTLDALRTRAVQRSHYRIADGNERYAFVALTIRLGPGRADEIKLDFLRLLLDTIETFLADQAPGLVVALSGEVQEIDPTHRINRNQIRHYRQQDHGAS